MAFTIFHFNEWIPSRVLYLQYTNIPFIPKVSIFYLLTPKLPSHPSRKTPGSFSGFNVQIKNVHVKMDGNTPYMYKIYSIWRCSRWWREAVDHGWLTNKQREPTWHLLDRWGMDRKTRNNKRKSEGRGGRRGHSCGHDNNWRSLPMSAVWQRKFHYVTWMQAEVICL